MACIDAETSKALLVADVCAREKKPLVDKINQLTDMLCWTLTEWQRGTNLPLLRKDIADWWEVHVKADILRKKDDLKQRALAKLTEEEKRVLGF